ncbi:MAG: transcriptional repressor [Candidatus Kerfeldbacteria bacterium]|nr:transcriptional repressor [Candidatus Kerfeldbacteria bacterium]
MEPSPSPSILLRRAKLKVTPTRVALLRILASAKHPLSIAKIARALRQSADRVTLYRALDALAKAGIVRRIDLQHGHAHYELAQDDHHHLVCTSCGRTASIRLPHRLTVSPVTLRRTGFARVTRHALEFFGLCRSCAATAPRVSGRRN